MSNLLSNLPNPKDLTQAISAEDGLLNPKTFGMDQLEAINVGDLTNDIANIDGDTPPPLNVPPTPNNLSPEGFDAIIKTPLNQLKNVNAESLLNKLDQVGNAVDIEPPEVDIKALMNKIVEQVLPDSSPSTPNTTLAPITDINGLGLDEFKPVLERIGQASLNAPIKVLRALLTVAEKIVATISDSDELKDIVEEALKDAVKKQIEDLRAQLPLSCLNDMLKDFGDNAQEQLLTLCEELFGRIQATDLSNKDEARALAKTVNQELMPRIDRLEATKQMLINLRDGDLSTLTQQLENLLKIASTQEALLDPAVKQVNSTVTKTLAGLRAPITELADNGKKIETFINTTAEKANEGAQNAATQIEASIQDVNLYIVQTELEIRRVEDKIVDFVDDIDIASILSAGMTICTRISEGVESFFTRVQELKIKLNGAVESMAGRLEEEVPAEFKKLENQIRAWLGQITTELESPGVKAALENARKGINTFKTKIDEASLQPVFDIVIDKTQELESKVQGIDANALGLPQKTALRVGGRILEEVKVDDILKPELIDAFREIQAPLLDLIDLLENRFVVIEDRINQFNPGTIANDLIVNADAYKTLLQILEVDLKPTKLIEPLKEAYQELLRLAESADPSQLIDEVQKLYVKLSQLLDTLAPEPLNRLVTDATQTVNYQLRDMRDNQLSAVADKIQDSLSLQSLLADTDLADLGELPLWEMLTRVLSGEYLKQITDTLPEVEERLAANLDKLNAESITPLLNDIKDELNRQLNSSEAFIKDKLSDLQTRLTNNTERRQVLVQQYQTVLSDSAISEDLEQALNRINMDLFEQVAEQVDTTIGQFATRANTELDETSANLSERLEGLKSQLTTVIQDNAAMWGIGDDKAITLDLTNINDLLLAIFHQQVSLPITRIVEHMQKELAPFGEAVAAIQGIATAVSAVPQTIDKAVATVINTLEENIREALSQTITSVDTFEDSVIVIINSAYEKIKLLLSELSPYWLFNHFIAGDFYDTPITQSTTTTESTSTEEHLSRIFFDHDKDDILEAQQTAIRQALADLEGKAVSTMTIEGYTDATGSSEYNVLLSERRARNVRDYIDQLTATDYRDQLQDAQLTLAFYGENLWEQNGAVPPNPSRRRVDIKITSAQTTVTTTTQTDTIAVADATGLLAIAARMVRPGGDDIAAFLTNQITPNQLAVLQSHIFSTPDGKLSPLLSNHRRLLLDTLNVVIRSDKLCSANNLTTVQNELSEGIDRLSNNTNQLPETDEEKAQWLLDINLLYRQQALLDQFIAAKLHYERAANKQFTKVRLNRVVLEAHYIEFIRISKQSLYGFILKQLAGLYPEQSLKRLDRLHRQVVTDIKALPQQLIQEPLDEEFDRLKRTLAGSFDIRGIFTTLNVKLEGVDDDLELGLDRLSGAYRKLLRTLEQKVS